MSQIRNRSGPLTADNEQSSVEAFTLKVVSPSAGASGPLSFPALPIRTTIKQLKQKIRETLPIRPSDEHQRLIHRGRLLAREDETMLEVFGLETLKNSDTHTLHLVLRPLPAESAPVDTNRLAVLEDIGNQPRPASAAHGPGPTIITPSYSPMPDVQSLTAQLEALRQQHLGQIRTQRLQEDERSEGNIRREMNALDQQNGGPLPETGSGLRSVLNNQRFQSQQHATPAIQQFLAQQQQDLASLGLQGPPSQHGNTGSPILRQGHFATGRQQRNHSSTYTQEGVGPNGERWHATITQTTTIVPNTSRSPRPSSRTDSQMQSATGVENMVQAVLSAADQGRIIYNGRSSPTLPGERPLTTPNVSNEVADTGSSAAPSEPILSSPSPIATSAADQLQSNITTYPNLLASSGSTVYILSSPNGPRALLFAPSENGYQSFFTPLLSSGHFSNHLMPQPRDQMQADIDVAHRRDRRRQRAARHAQAGAAPPIPDAGVGPQLGHPHNPNAGAAIVQLWPHVWLIIRLMGFVWFFTSSNSSWWRTIMVSCIALLVFLVNTGIFNGFAAQIWAPIRSHLEALLPLAGPNANPARIPTPPEENAAIPQGDAPGPVGGAAHRVPAPDPAQVAARLLEQRRRADRNWLWNQVRRAEHATVLFVASLIPGVGERHIAARAAEENIAMEAERQREAAQAAAAAAEEAGNTTNQTIIDEPQESTIPGGAEEQGSLNQEGNIDGNNEAANGRLIDV